MIHSNFIVCSCLLAIVTALFLDSVVSDCTGPVRYYESIRCQPIYPRNRDANNECPSGYDCAHLESPVRDDQCNLNGVIYDGNQAILPEDVFGVGCKACMCQPNGTHPSTACALLKCRVDDHPQHWHCYRKINVDCCSAQVCVDPEYMAKCEIDGKSYGEGDVYSAPGFPGIKCQCNNRYKAELSLLKNNKGRIMPRNCQTATCDVQGYSPLTLDEMKYPPIFNSNQNSYLDCPTGFLKESVDGAEIHRASQNNQDANNPAPGTCQWGKSVMGIGDFANLRRDGNKCVKCSCELPPYPTCREVNDDTECN